MKKQLGAVNEYSTWWQFIPFFEKRIDKWLTDFRTGKHCFAPLNHYQFTTLEQKARLDPSNLGIRLGGKERATRSGLPVPYLCERRRQQRRNPKCVGYNNEVVRCFAYLDRLMLHLIHTIIRPTFKHFISPFCFHLKGPSQIKIITQMITAALNTGRFKYCMRIDIKSYFSSINHRILFDQVKQHFDDPMILQYLETVITTGIDYGGQMFLPTQGIPLRSPLSPFFGALYLAELDRAFIKREGMFYCRYMDDICVLVETKRQYTQARKRLFSILKDLRLKVSPKKTRMGSVNAGFHFLGVAFAVAQTPHRKNQLVTVTIHKRTSRRALDRVNALEKDAVHPAAIQRYLSRWARWWVHIGSWKMRDLIFYWAYCITGEWRHLLWIGRGLIPWSAIPAINPLR